MSAAKTGVNGKLDAWAFIMLRANRPRPRTRFSWKSSGTTSLMFATFTLFTIPVIDLRSASHASRWYSALVLSADAASRNARSRAGGMYTPPERVFTLSFANSARASAVVATAVLGPSAPFWSFSSSLAASFAASWRSRSARRTGSTSLMRGRSTSAVRGGGETERRRLAGGAPSKFSGDREPDLASRQQAAIGADQTIGC